MTLVLAYTPSGSYTAPPTLPDAVNRLRQDLFDRTQNIAAGATQRWADDDLTRALDRAIDEYSFIMPLIQSALTATLPRTRAYALPSGAWWVESVEYPTGRWPQQFVSFEDNVVTPSLGVSSSGPTVAAGGAGPLTGVYTWAVTYFKSGGEGLLGAPSGSLTLAGKSASLSAIPVGPPGTVGRNVYRTAAGGTTYLLVSQILDNTTTVLTDAVPDAALGAAAPSVDTTANLPQFVLKIDDYFLPQDTSGVLTVTYAGKHQLTGSGTSLPEQHHDIILMGAAAYAMLAYQVPTNDLFEYQDGELRDKVNEVKVSAAWLSSAQRALGDFRERLDLVRRQRDAGAAAIAQWGDVAVRWGRL